MTARRRSDQCLIQPANARMPRTRIDVVRGLAIGVLLAFSAIAAPVAADPIRIGIIGDQTGTSDLDKSYAVLQQGVAALQMQKLDVVLHAGDLVESTHAPDDIRRRFKQATGILNQLPVPWYMTAGDHDVNPPVYEQDSTDRSREQLFQELYGAVNPRVKSHLYYSFDVKNYHFVVLYCFEALDSDPRWGNVFYSQISDAQFAWLSSDLAQHAARSKGIVVLLHHPLWYTWSNWARVHALLARYHVRTVIAGHFHYNQYEPRIDNIDYRVVGATGADTKIGSPNAGDLQHVTVLTVDGHDLDFKMIPLAPYKRIAWTSRQVMDRVQAIDSLLGNVGYFPSRSPVFLQNGALVAKCGTTEPAKLVLDQLGNADASPVDASIRLDAANTTVSGAFGDGMCLQDVRPLACRLKASAGVGMANTSIVEISQYPVPPPLWTGIISSANPPPAAGTPITATVQVSFTAENQTYTVSRSAVANVQACQ